VPEDLLDSAQFKEPRSFVLDRREAARHERLQMAASVSPRNRQEADLRPEVLPA